MWRRIRIGILLLLLASVAQSAWVARTRTAEWKTSLRVVVYPISADASATSTQYVSELRKATFDPIEAFFRTEGKKYGVSLGDPVDVFLAPAIPSRPPVPPFGGSTLRIILSSLELRYWAWRNDTHHGPNADVRIFQPLYPQRRAEIMAGRIPLSETRAEIAEAMKQVVIGAKTAREISWTK